MISRRGLLVAGFAATASGSAGLLYKYLSPPKQHLFPIIDPQDTESFLRQTIDLARATPTGTLLYHVYSQIDGHRIRVADANDQRFQGVEAAYSPATKEIVFKHPQNVGNEARDDCDTSIRNGSLKNNQRSQCEELNRIMVAQRTKMPQPGILVHELTHAAQDKYGLVGLILDSMAYSTSDDARKLYVINEIMGDLLSLKSYVELAQAFPENEVAILQNVSLLSSLDAYIILSHAMRGEKNGDDLRDAFQQIIPILIANGRYNSYIENTIEITRNMHQEVDPRAISSTLSDESYNGYATIANAIMDCKNLFSKEFIQQLSFEFDLRFSYEVPEDERQRISVLLRDNMDLIEQWPQHLGIEGARSLNLSP